ncbi:hypothetical protein FACS1894204_03390 [Synergistales bacterium]|nr:hypothetical protein FACS1894204_03390 [Synergistales bacterium]
MKKIISGNFVLSVFCVGMFAVFFAASADAAGMVQTHNTRMQSRNQTLENYGAGGGMNADLKAIPRSGKPVTATGLPAGAFGSGSSLEEIPEDQRPIGRVVLAGDKMDSAIGSGLVGSKLDRVCGIAEHMGYKVVKKGYTPNSIDAVYSFNVMNGKARVATVYFDRSMRVSMVE